MPSNVGGSWSAAGALEVRELRVRMLEGGWEESRREEGELDVLVLIENAPPPVCRTGKLEEERLEREELLEGE